MLVESYAVTKPLEARAFSFQVRDVFGESLKERANDTIYLRASENGEMSVETATRDTVENMPSSVASDVVRQDTHYLWKTPAFVGKPGVRPPIAALVAATPFFDCAPAAQPSAGIDLTHVSTYDL
jgi:hypothetical protein